MNPGLRGDLYQAIAYVHLLRGDLAASARTNETSLRLAVPPYDLDGRGQALLTRGRLALVRFEATAARTAFGAALDYAGQHESASYQSAALAGLASAHMALGDVAAAADALDRARALHARVGERALELQLAWAEGDLAQLRGDGDTAERLHDEQLVEWLWPEHDPARATNSLKTALKLGRRALEPWLEGAGSHFLQRASQVLSFDDTGVRVDLDEHTRLVADARRATAAGLIDEAIARLEEAAALYRGDLLDPEDRYEAWAEAAREQWRRFHLEALVELSHLRASRGNYESAATVMRTVVTLDPLRETAYRDLMHYALLRGRRDEAMATYRECTRALEQGLGVSPEPATRQLLADVPLLD